MFGGRLMKSRYIFSGLLVGFSCLLILSQPVSAEQNYGGSSSGIGVVFNQVQSDNDQTNSKGGGGSSAAGGLVSIKETKPSTDDSCSLTTIDGNFQSGGGGCGGGRLSTITTDNSQNRTKDEKNSPQNISKKINDTAEIAAASENIKISSYEEYFCSSKKKIEEYIWI